MYDNDAIDTVRLLIVVCALACKSTNYCSHAPRRYPRPYRSNRGCSRSYLPTVTHPLYIDPCNFYTLYSAQNARSERLLYSFIHLSKDRHHADYIQYPFNRNLNDFIPSALRPATTQIPWPFVLNRMVAYKMMCSASKKGSQSSVSGLYLDGHTNMRIVMRQVVFKSDRCSRPLMMASMA
jgi:hypothetical protein